MATGALVLGMYNTMEIHNIKSTVNDLTNHIRHMDVKVTETHNTAVKLAESQRSYYHYSQTRLNQITIQLNNIVCGIRDVVFLHGCHYAP